MPAQSKPARTATAARTAKPARRVTARSRTVRSRAAAPSTVQTDAGPQSFAGTPRATIEVSPEAFAQMLELADNVPQPSPSLRSGWDAYRKLVASGRVRTNALE